MARCLVLGANGFIGSHLVDSLVTQGHFVRAFDRFGGDILFDDNVSIEKYYGNFLNRGDLDAALEDIEYVFHFISTTTPASAENDPLIDIDTNIKMSVELFQACSQAHHVKRVIFASTGGAIYGDQGDRPHREVDRPEPRSPYAIGKLSIEHYLRYFKIKHNLDSVILRISNPYGERQALHSRQGVIPVFIENIVRQRPITVLGDGSMVRDYVYVKDVAEMIAAMFERPAKHDMYNLGSGKGISLNDVIKEIETVSKLPVTRAHQAAPATYVHKVVLDTSRFEKEFSLKPETDLATGLTRTLRYIKSEVQKTPDL